MLSIFEVAHDQVWLWVISFLYKFYKTINKNVQKAKI